MKLKHLKDITRKGAKQKEKQNDLKEKKQKESKDKSDKICTEKPKEKKK